MNHETPPLVSPLASTARPAALLALLEAAFGSGSTVVVDDSHHHVGHATAAACPRPLPRGSSR